MVALAALSLAGIFDHELWTPDEPRDAEISREISGAVPTLNGSPFLEKPPLYFWTTAFFFKIFGAHAWSARLSSILFFWGTLIFTYLLARRMFDERIGRLAALFLATMVMVVDLSHKCIVDNALLFFTTGTFYWLYRAEGKLWRYLVAYLFALGAFYSKGFIGVGLAGASFAAYLIWTRNYREFLRAQPWFAVLIVGAGAYAWLSQLTPEQQNEFLIHNQFGRFAGDFGGGHRWPFYKYGPWLLYALAPWTLILPFTFRLERFLVSWMAVSVVVLCLALTKREIYLLPICPAAAIMVAAGIDQAKKFAIYTTAGLLALAQLGAIGFAIYAQNWIGLAIALGVVAGAIAYVYRKDWATRLGFGAAGFFVAGIFAAVPYVDEHKNLRPFFSQIPRGERIAAFDPDETTLALVPFYSGRYVIPIKDISEAKQHAQLIVIVKRNRPEEEAELAALQKDFPHVWTDFVAKPNRRMLLLSRVPK
jgi:4-amino-4-deoxy-L-arabinose transferase-like glycosyltransferase